LKPKIVVFASGSGSNFQAIIDAINNGALTAEIVSLITNKSDAGAIQRAEVAGIPYHVIRKSDWETETHYVNHLISVLDELQPELIVLAGYLLKLPSDIIKLWPNRIINIHPSLLPDYGGKGFYGLHVHRAVLADKREESGCTVHFVTEEFDEGPIMAQRTVPVYSNDTPETLAARILEHEHIILPQTIHLLLNVFFA
jgi:formyltetrahydrofolate-dependent phosphoribosylglycinamide formyltransferase